MTRLHIIKIILSHILKRKENKFNFYIYMTIKINAFELFTHSLMMN